MQSCRERAANVALDVVTRVQRFVRTDTRAFAGKVKYLLRRFRATGIACGNREVEKPGKTGAIQARVAVGNRADDKTRFQALERGQDIVETFDLVSRRPEDFESFIGKRFIFAALFQCTSNRQATQFADVAGMFGMQVLDFPAARAKACGHEVIGGCGTLFRKPCVQTRFGALDERRDFPEGVIEIKRDQSDLFFHFGSGLVSGGRTMP